MSKLKLCIAAAIVAFVAITLIRFVVAPMIIGIIALAAVLSIYRIMKS